jgi:hypothetical protein
MVVGMGRFWPSAALALLGCAGCSGRTIAGAWTGALPFPGASECRIRLGAQGAFDFACSGADPWAGFGRYEFRNDLLTLRFEKLARGAAAGHQEPAPLEARVSGPGSRITLTFSDGGKIEWKRTLEGAP